jgi:hypothetical protein
MTFVYPLLLGGLLLAGLPVLLHFLIRKKPTTQLFPAFRFLMQKRRSNTRNLRLRHLLLLLLRIALIVLVCLALARPRVLHETLGWSRERPVALVLIFDTSPSMEYKSGDVTRLDLARKRCIELLDQLPDDCRVLILDTADPTSFSREDWLKSLEKARQRVKSLTIRPTSSPVTKALEEAYRRLDKLDDADAENMPRFVCVFSDRTKASWDSSATLRRPEKAQTFYFDVGVDEPADFAIVQADLPVNRQSFTEGGTIKLSVVVKATGANLNNKLTVEIGTASIPQITEVEAGKQRVVTFEIDTKSLKLGPGLHQADVKLETKQDSLSFNNVRHVTFAIQPKQRILVLTDDVKKADDFLHALKSSLYEADVRAVADDKGDPFSRYEAIFLDGVAAPDDKLWAALEAFVQQGGGLGIIPPGDELQKDAYNSAAAKKLMPAEIVKKAATENGVWLVGAEALDHPLLRRSQAWFTDYDEFLFRRAKHYWLMKPFDRKSVVVRYEDDEPAILDRVLPNAAGKVLLLTTPMDSGKEWNNYYDRNRWFYPGLAWLYARYLCKEPGDAKFNFQFGGDPPVVNQTQAFQKYVLSSGDSAEEIRFDEKGKWVGDRLPRAGNYTLSGTNPGETKALHKFSINVPGEECDLTRVPVADIEELLGADSLLPQDSRRNIIDTLPWDEPIELFPWLMILMLFLLALENLLANRFYRQEPAGEASDDAVR